MHCTYITYSTTSAAARTVTSTRTTPSTRTTTNDCARAREFSIAHFDRRCMRSNLRALLKAAPGHHDDDGDDDEDDDCDEMDAEQCLHY